jgi:molybdopterin-binding protein
MHGTLLKKPTARHRRGSAEELALKPGDAVRVVIKSTEVMVQKD